MLLVVGERTQFCAIRFFNPFRRTPSLLFSELLSSAPQHWSITFKFLFYSRFSQLCSLYKGKTAEGSEPIVAMYHGNSSKKNKREESGSSRRSIPRNALYFPAMMKPCDDAALAKDQHKFCLKILKGMLEDERCHSFSKPVADLWLISDIPDYFHKIKRPMDLGTCLEDLRRGRFTNTKTGYFDFRMLLKNVHLVFQNCLEYNVPSSPIAKLAQELLAQFDTRFSAIPLSFPHTSEDDAEESDEEGLIPADPTGSEQDEIDYLAGDLERLKKRKAKSRRAIARLEAGRTLPMSEEDIVELIEDVKSAPWEKVKQVHKILKKHATAPSEELEKVMESINNLMVLLKNVQEYQLRMIHDIIRPSVKRAQEAARIEKYETKIAGLESRLKVLYRITRRQ